MRYSALLLLVLVVACYRPPAQRPATDVPETFPTELPDYSQYIRQGVGFLAIGQEPAWSLTIQPDRMMVFRAYSDSVQVATPAEQRDTDGTRTYETIGPEGRFRVRIRPATYTDPMSGHVFPNQVEVMLGQKEGEQRTYRGGGEPLTQLLLLNDNWVLTHLGTEPIDSATTNRGRLGTPRLECQLGNGRVVGTGGCNRMSGTLRADNRYVIIGEIISTRMACPGTDQLEARFLKALEGAATYQIENGVLTLSRSGKPILTFRRTD